MLVPPPHSCSERTAVSVHRPFRINEPADGRFFECSANICFCPTLICVILCARNDDPVDPTVHKTVAEFVVGAAKRAKSTDGLLRSFGDLDIELNTATRGFAAELMARMPRAAPSAAKTAARAKEQQQQNFARKQTKYKMVELEAEAAQPARVKVSAAEKKEKRKRHTRKRDDASATDDGDDGGGSAVVAPAPRKRRKDGEDDGDDAEAEMARAEDARLADLKDRDEFAERLKNKDKDRTKKIGGVTRARLDEIKKRQELANADRKKLVPMLREQARQEYLKDRQATKVDALEEDIADEEFIFAGELTEAERVQLEKKKELLRLAREHQNLDQSLKVDRYVIPDLHMDEHEQTRDRSKQDSVLAARYHDEPLDENRGPNYAQLQWEEEQMANAMVGKRMGAGDAEEVMKAKGQAQKEYDYVFEDISHTFVMTETHGGEGRDPDEVRESEAAKKRRTMKEVFPASRHQNTVFKLGLHVRFKLN